MAPLSDTLRVPGHKLVSTVRDRITVDMRGMKPALEAGASTRIAPSEFVRQPWRLLGTDCVRGTLKSCSTVLRLQKRLRFAAGPCGTASTRREGGWSQPRRFGGRAVGQI